MSVVGATYRWMANAATPTAQRTLDEVFAGPLPEMVAQALREHAVLERMIAAYNEGKPLDDRARELLQRPEVQELLAEIVASPAIRTALARQSTSFAEEAVGAVRRRTRVLDSAVETPPRRWLRRSSTVDTHCAGLATRAIAFLVDGVVVGTALLLAAAALGIVTSFAGPVRPGWLAGTVLTSWWLVTQTLYFAGFWSAVGQTPGMRLMHIRVVSTSHLQLGFGRSLLRAVALVVSIIPCFAGFLPALFDRRRRALPDFVASTAVVSTEPQQ